MARIKKGGTASAGKTVTRKSRSNRQRPIMLTNKPMFVYLHHPRRWTVIEGEVVPQMKELRFVDDPNVDPDDERAKWRKRGWVEIPWHVRGEDTNYMKEHDGPNGTKLYLSEWETPHRGSSIIVPDPAGYVKFLLWLKSHDKVEPPEVYVLEDLADRARSRFEDYASKAALNPKVQRLADRAAADLSALTAEIDSILAPAAKKKGAGDEQKAG